MLATVRACGDYKRSCRWTVAWSRAGLAPEAPVGPTWGAEASAHLEHVVPCRGTPGVNVKVSVAVLHTDQAVLGHLGLGQQCVVRPVVFYPGQFLYDVRRLHKAGHSGGTDRNSQQ